MKLNDISPREIHIRHLNAGGKTTPILPDWDERQIKDAIRKFRRRKHVKSYSKWTVEIYYKNEWSTRFGGVDWDGRECREIRVVEFDAPVNANARYLTVNEIYELVKF